MFSSPSLLQEQEKEKSEKKSSQKSDPTGKKLFSSLLMPFMSKTKTKTKTKKEEVKKKPCSKEWVHNPSSEDICDFLSECIDMYMIPRVDIVALSTTSSFDHVVKEFLQTGYRWLPVFRDTLDTIVGILPLHSVLSLQNSPHLQEKWYRHVQMPAFYPNTMTIYDALYRVHHSHKNPIIFVVDEHGGIEGMLSRNHLQKAFVRQYLNLRNLDGLPQEEKMILSRSPVLVVDGRIDLGTFAQEIQREDLFSEDEDVYTLGGWICAYMGRVPLTGEILHHPSGMIFEIRHGTARKILQIALLHEVTSNKDISSISSQRDYNTYVPLCQELPSIQKKSSPPSSDNSWDITHYKALPRQEKEPSLLNHDKHRHEQLGQKNQGQESFQEKTSSPLFLPPSS